MFEEVSIECPYCGSTFELALDLFQGSHQMVEDCRVCCRPIELRAFVKEDGSWRIQIDRA